MPTLTLGAWRATPVESGRFRLDGGAMFGVVPKTLWSKVHAADDRNRIAMAMRCLLLEGEGRRILVDDGAGDKLPAKLADIYALDHSEHTIERSLAALGLGVGDITDVLLTHLHFDHAGGSTRMEGGVVVPRFPNAIYHVQRRQWENAHRPNPRERASFMPENYDPIEQAGRLRLWEGPQKPWAGIETFVVNGHTRGMQCVRVAGGDGTLYFVADLIPTRSHVRIPYVMGYDVAAIETMEEKRAFLTHAIAERAWVCLEHDDQIALARPRVEGDDFAWAETVPADASTTRAGS